MKITKIIKKIILSVPILMCLLAITGCKNENSIVIYSSMEEEREQVLRKQLEEKFPNVDVVVQHMGTGNSAAKIENEKENIEADIIIALETSHMEKLQDNFASLNEFDTSMYLDGINTSDKYLIWDKPTSNLIIDNKYFTEHKLEIPKTYDDLLKSEYKNLIAMPDPTTSGTGYAFYLNVVNIKGEEKAIEYFKKLKENVREFTASGSGPANLLKQGEIAIALTMTYQGVQDINDGYDFKVVSLDTGSPYNSSGISIIKGKENKENLKEVFQWLIDDFNKYDKENYMPDIILKDQEPKVENYPTDLVSADMTGINDGELKEKLTEKWSSEVNG